MACSWLQSGNLLCRYKDRLEVVDTAEDRICHTVSLHQALAAFPSPGYYMAVSPCSRFAALVGESAVALMHLSSRTGVEVTRFADKEVPRSVVWNAVGDKLIVGRGRAVHIFRFGKLSSGAKASDMAKAVAAVR